MYAVIHVPPGECGICISLALQNTSLADEDAIEKILLQHAHAVRCYSVTAALTHMDCYVQIIISRG